MKTTCSARHLLDVLPRSASSYITWATIATLSVGLLLAQARPDGQPPQATKLDQQSRPTISSPNYVLGPDDVLTFLSSEIDELNKNTVGIGLDGEISLPLIGRVHAGGLTINELEQKIQADLKTFVRHPDVVANITEYHSQPVSVLGNLNSPGVFQLQGDKNLYEMIAMAGGLDLQAGNTITITRKLKWGPLPLPDAKTDPSGQFSIAHVSVKELMRATDPALNILTQPEDVISVSKQEQVYVLGAVIKPGAIVLGDENSITTMRALSEAWGLGKAASPAKARIMRLVPGTNNRTETPIDLKKLIAGKVPDIQLQANDILIVPSSLAKGVAAEALQAALQAGTIGAIAAH